MAGDTPQAPLQPTRKIAKPKPSPRDAPGRFQLAYLCPKCNMGEGQTPQQYAGVVRDWIMYISTWEKREMLERHIIASHIDDFARENSSEYVCRYCPCAIVAQGPTAACSPRFATKGEVVNHLLDFHAKGPRRLKLFEHRCPPISHFSYPDDILDCYLDHHEADLA